MLTRKKNKWLIVSLVLTLAASLALAGCSGNNNKSNAESSPSTDGNNASPSASDSAPPAEPKGDPVEISLYYPGTPQKDVGLVEKEANKYLEEKLNAHLKIVAIDFGDWDNKLNLSISAGKEMDIVFTAAWQKYAVNVGKGAFIPLNDLVAEYGKDINLEPAFWEGSQINGKNYGVPTNKELAATRGVLFRKDLVEKYNIDISGVKTWADLEPILKTIKEKEPGITPWYISNQGNGGSNGILDNLDWDYLGDASVPGVIKKIGTDTKILNAVETPEFMDAAKLVRKFFKMGLINSDAATTNVKPNEKAKTGKVFLWTDGLKPGKAEEEAIQVGFPLAQIEFTKPTITTGDASGAMLAISKTSKHPELAMQIINLLHSDKYFNNLINYGIEGTHYVKTDKENIIDLPPGADPAKIGYKPGAQWELGNQYLNYLYKTEDPDKWKKFQEFNAAGIKSPGLGFTFDNTNVLNEIGAVTTVSTQYFTALSSGSVDPEAVIPKYLAALKDAGVDKIIKEKQEQFDKFLASKK
ncbi:extracellular solute-binding protein [Cohnella endophytica]|uniref:Extracellular solute-binding protein n=1 Tax=Cohnella endophytica TaxID=2419778 RepID=A0A494XNV8_9BACL|nr:ABC transporter substrate-binding protein [Cohnella endophytica]RKP49809.1 extracellular solute-binding protein [Cohnella endophytica]